MRNLRSIRQVDEAVSCSATAFSGWHCANKTQCDCSGSCHSRAWLGRPPSVSCAHNTLTRYGGFAQVTHWAGIQKFYVMREALLPRLNHDLEALPTQSSEVFKVGGALCPTPAAWTNASEDRAYILELGTNLQVRLTCGFCFLYDAGGLSLNGHPCALCTCAGGRASAPDLTCSRRHDPCAKPSLLTGGFVRIWSRCGRV